MEKSGAATKTENEISQSLPIPEHKMGWIVGKKGSYIQQLSRKSGAHISISESTSREFGFVWKYVQITGTGRAVDRAKKLLHIRLDRLEPKPSASKPGDASAGDISNGDLSPEEGDVEVDGKGPDDSV